MLARNLNLASYDKTRIGIGGHVFREDYMGASVDEIAPVYYLHARAARRCGFVAYEPDADGVLRVDAAVESLALTDGERSLVQLERIAVDGVFPTGCLADSLATLDLIFGMAGQGVGHGTFAGTVGTHNGVNFSLVDFQIETFED